MDKNNKRVDTTGINDVYKMIRAGPAGLLLKWAGIFSLVFSATMLSSGCAFISQIYLARHISLLEYGFIVAALALANALQAVCNLGLPWFITQIASHPGSGSELWLKKSLPVLGLSTVLATIASWTYFEFNTLPGSLAIFHFMILYVFILISQPAMELAASYYQISHRFRWMSAIQSFTQFSRLALVLTLVAAQRLNYEAVLTGYAFIGACGLAWSALVLYRWAETKTAPACMSAPGYRAVIAGTTPYAGMTLLTVGIGQLAVVIVNSIGTSAGAAVFGLASLIASAVYLIPSTLYVKLLLPTIARWYQIDRKRFVALFELGIAGMLVMGSVAMICMLSFGPLLCVKIFGTRYSGISPILSMLALTIPMRFVSSAFGSVLFLRDSIKRKVLYHAIAGIVLIGSELALVSLLGTVGASIAAVIGETAALILQYKAVRSVVPEFKLIDALRPSQLRQSYHVIVANIDLP